MDKTNLSQRHICVIHNYLTWLHSTENWIYTQVRCLPDAVEKHIVCKETMNLEQFALPNIHCFAEIAGWTRIRVAAYGLYRLGPHFRRHSAFLLWIAKQKRATIIHSHFGYVGWRYAKVAKRAGLKHVVTFYGVDVSRLPKEDPAWLERYQEMFSLIDAVLCEGPHMARCVVNLGCPKNKVRVQHLGVPVGEIRFEPRHWEPGMPFRVLIVGTFREKKGIPYALEALARIKQKVDLQVSIIGDAGTTQESLIEKKKILDIIEKHGLVSKVRLLGFQPLSMVRQEAYRHHVFLSPSVTCSNGDTEGGAPVTIIEMAASGIPVVSTNHCDIPEVVENGVSGLLAEERDVDRLVECLDWLIENHASWGKMVLAARRRIENEFDAKKQGSRLAALYEEVVRD